MKTLKHSFPSALKSPLAFAVLAAMVGMSALALRAQSPGSPAADNSSEKARNETRPTPENRSGDRPTAGSDRPGADPARNNSDADRSNRATTDRDGDRDERSSGAARDDQPANQRDRAQLENRQSGRDNEPRSERARDRDDGPGRREERIENRSDRRQERAEDRRSERSSRQGLSIGASFSAENEGLSVDNIEESGLAARAGLRKGDAILLVNGNEVSTEAQFNSHLHARSGQPIRVVVWRDGRRWTIYLPPQPLQQSGYGQYDRGQNMAQRANYYEEQERAELGVILDPRYQDGALVDRVAPDSPAEEAGLRRGDFIHGVNGRRVRSHQDLSDIVGQMNPGDVVEIEFTRRVERTVEARLRPSQKPLAQDGRYRSNQPAGYSESSADDRDGRRSTSNDDSPSESNRNRTDSSSDDRRDRDSNNDDD